MKPAYIALSALALCTACTPSSQLKEEGSPLRQFTANEVSLLSSDFDVRASWDHDFMLSLDVDRLLYFFLDEEHRTGLEPYGSWESLDLKGHTAGHYLTAMSMLYAQTCEEAALQRVNRMVDGFEECQQRLGTGLITAFRLDLLDECETKGTGWAPYYTLHKILQGLLDAYTYAGNQKALQLAIGMGDHFVQRKASIVERNIDWTRNLDIMEVGGFAESMLNLYALSGKPEHLDVARFFHQWSKLTPAAEGRDELHHPSLLAQHRNRRSPNADPLHNMHHCNATIPQFLAAARDFELTGDSLYWRAADHFWHFVTEHRTYCNGTTGNFEHWSYGPDSLSQELDYRVGETCCTYNMIKLSNELFRLHPDVAYADYVERALVNDIIGTIYPETSDFMYFHTQRPGSNKIFGRNVECFWCCTGSGMENPQRYVESIYFTDSESLYVNLPVPSVLCWDDRGILLSQKGNYPQSGASLITIEEGQGNFTLCLRLPSWCQEYQLMLNGESLDVKPEQGYLRCRREWKKGDQLSLDLHYTLRAEPLADDPSIVSLSYGPLVLAADLGQVDTSMVLVTNNFYGGVPEPWQVKEPVPALTGSLSELSNWLLPTEVPNQFMTTATSDGRTLTLLPLYQITDRKFTCYFINQ